MGKTDRIYGLTVHITPGLHALCVYAAGICGVLLTHHYGWVSDDQIKTIVAATIATILSAKGVRYGQLRRRQKEENGGGPVLGSEAAPSGEPSAEE